MMFRFCLGFMLITLSKFTAQPSGFQEGCLPPEQPVLGYIKQEAEKYNHGDVITFGCKEKYKLIGNAKKTCQNGTWGTSETPVCGMTVVAEAINYIKNVKQHIACPNTNLTECISKMCDPQNFNKIARLRYQLSPTDNETIIKISSIKKYENTTISVNILKRNLKTACEQISLEKKEGDIHWIRHYKCLVDVADRVFNLEIEWLCSKTNPVILYEIGILQSEGDPPRAMYLTKQYTLISLPELIDGKEDNYSKFKFPVQLEHYFHLEFNSPTRVKQLIFIMENNKNVTDRIKFDTDEKMFLAPKRLCQIIKNQIDKITCEIRNPRSANNLFVKINDAVNLNISEIQVFTVLKCPIRESNPYCNVTELNLDRYNLLYYEPKEGAYIEGNHRLRYCNVSGWSPEMPPVCKLKNSEENREFLNNSADESCNDDRRYTAITFAFVSISLTFVIAIFILILLITMRYEIQFVRLQN